MLDPIEKRRRQLLASSREVPNAFGESGSSTLGEVTHRASMPRDRCRRLIQVAMQAPVGDILELGSNVGISAAYLARHLASVGAGRLVTIEGVPSLAAAARRTAKILGLEGTMEVRCQAFAEALDEIERSWSFILLDGEHAADPTLRYVRRLRDLLVPGGILLIDDCTAANGLDQTFNVIQAWDCWQDAWTDGRFGVLRLEPMPNNA